MEIKNYVISFIGEEWEKITASEAKKIMQAWNIGVKFIFVNSNAYASHQIKAIKRIKKSEEIELYIMNGLLEDKPIGDMLGANKWDEESKMLIQKNSISLPKNHDKLLA